jgi:hypothetical protein
VKSAFSNLRGHKMRSDGSGATAGQTIISLAQEIKESITGVLGMVHAPELTTKSLAL